MFKGDSAVVGGLSRMNVQIVLQRFENRVAAHDRAQGVGAHPDQVFAGGRTPVHRVEGGNRGHFGLGQAQLCGTERNTRRREAPVLGLDEM
jgi:hypothetical protein